MKAEMVHAAMKIIWAHTFPAVKIKGKRTCFRWSVFMVDYFSGYRSQMAFMRLDFESDKPRVNAKLRVMMAEL